MREIARRIRNLQEYYNPSALHLLCLVAICRILLDLLYIHKLVPIWGYSGFEYNFHFGNYTISWFFLYPIMYFIRKLKMNCDRIDYHVFFAFVFLYMLPLSSVFGLCNIPLHFWGLLFIYWWLFLYLFVRVDIKLPQLHHLYGKLIFDTVFVICIIVIVYVSWKYTNFRLHFNIFDVYGIRVEARTYTMPTLFSYFLVIGNGVLPMLTIIFLNKKRKVLAFICIAAILLNFGIYALKTTVFVFVISLILSFVYVNKTVFLYPIGVIGLCIISFFSESVLSLFRRVFYVPPYLINLYYDFFKDSPKDYLRQSILRHFGFQSPYETPISYMLGEINNNGGGNLTCGGFSDAYMNFGIIGVFVYPLILVGILKVFRSASDGLQIKILVAPLIIFSVYLLGTTLGTALLTGGLLVIIILLYTMNK